MALESPTVPAGSDGPTRPRSRRADDPRQRRRDDVGRASPQLARRRSPLGPLLGATPRQRPAARRGHETARRELPAGRDGTGSRPRAHRRVRGERATFGAQVGRWLTRRRAEWAPVKSLRGRLVSLVVRRCRAASGAAPPVSHARLDAASTTRRARARSALRSVSGCVTGWSWHLRSGPSVLTSSSRRAADWRPDPPVRRRTVRAALALKRRWRRPDLPPGARFPRPSRPLRWTALLPIAACRQSAHHALSFARRPDALRLWWSALLLLGVFAATVSGGTSRIFASAVEPPEGLLWLLAVACVVLTLVAHRPDPDDAFYVNVAVAAVGCPPPGVAQPGHASRHRGPSALPSGVPGAFLRALERRPWPT